MKIQSVRMDTVELPAGDATTIDIKATAGAKRVEITVETKPGRFGILDVRATKNGQALKTEQRHALGELLQKATLQDMGSRITFERAVAMLLIGKPRAGWNPLA